MQTNVAQPNHAALVQRVVAWNKAYNENPNRAVAQATHAFPGFSQLMSIKLCRCNADVAFTETIRKVVLK
jgi:hypothetical protein